MAVDLSKIGKRYGRLTVQAFAGQDRHTRAKFTCLCDCGNSKVMSIVNLGRSAKSCGCLRAELLKERSVSKEHKAEVRKRWEERQAKKAKRPASFDGNTYYE